MSIPIDMVPIPAGRAILGSSEEEIAALAEEYGFHPSTLAHECPKREVDMPAFAIDLHEVTHAAYAKFVEETGHPAPASWVDKDTAKELSSHPVTQVTWFDANAYAKWAGKRLPTAAEWEYAARGPDGLTYPWGNEWNMGQCNCCRPLVCGMETETTPVDFYPNASSSFGVLDMAGNVAEWTADPITPECEDIRVVKSAAWCFSQPWHFRASYMGRSQPTANVTVFMGFRCAVSLEVGQ